MSDKELINKISDLGDITIDKRRRWSIEFDDYGIQGVIDVMRQHFVEQACVVVDQVIFDYRKKVRSINQEYDPAKEVYGMLTIRDALRKKFK